MLILIVTRQCDLRCSYCPTVKDGWPVLSADDAIRAIDHYIAICGGGEIKLFGGEPLLEPEIVSAIVTDAASRAEITRITLCTNGTHLTGDWLDLLQRTPKLAIALSIDGAAEDHDRYRRTPDRARGSYDAIAPLLPRFTIAPRLYVTQVVPPGTAHRAAINFHHLFDLGFRRFKILPALYVNWSDAQLAALRGALAEIAAVIVGEWRAGRYAYVRNLFSRSTMPAFNRAMVVDADGAIFASDAVITNISSGIRERLRAGAITALPTLAELEATMEAAGEIVASLYPERTRQSTHRAEQELRRFCRTLAPEFVSARMLRTSPVAPAVLSAPRIAPTRASSG
ncbi:MAG TPA: radical SAM protein [Thermoanaerobaculia bacterium]|nr:radical SAM protein [Thermoanaerobaculia bacterium]